MIAASRRNSWRNPIAVGCQAIVVIALSFAVFLSIAADVLADAGDPLIRYADAARLAPAAADAILEDDLTTLQQVRDRNDTNPNARVVNGAPVEIENFAEVFRVAFSGRFGPSTCTGVLIALDTVLTAGHCACGTSYKLSIEVGGTRPFVTVDAVGLPSTFPGFDCSVPLPDQIGKDLAFIRIPPFEHSDGYGHIFGEDKRMVRLKLPVIRPAIKVLSDQQLRTLFIAGFGATESGTLTRTLLGATVGVRSRFCAEGRVELSACAMYREFSLGRTVQDDDTPPTDSCGGDSGGPAYRMDSNLEFAADGKNINRPSDKTLVGIVSRALVGVNHPYPGYCGGGGIYTAVGTAPVLAWLRENDIDFVYEPELQEARE